METAADIPLLVTSENSSSERRISPSWTIAHLKARLEPVTGVPASCQKLQLRLSASQPPLPIESAGVDGDETTQLSSWPLQAYAEIHVTDTRPPGARANYTDVSRVAKYEMSASDYESRADSVLAWKKAQKLGRFDPDAPSLERQRDQASFREADERSVTVGRRCRLLPDSDHRRGVVRFVGRVPEIPGVGAWVGVELDEPTGKNDGTVGGTRYFECHGPGSRGVFVRPERVEVGDFAVLDELADDDEDEF